MPEGGAQHDLCDAVELPRGGAGVEDVRRQGSGILDAPSDLALRPSREERCDQGGGSSSQALHERGRAEAGVARVTLGDAVEPPREGRSAYSM